MERSLPSSAAAEVPLTGPPGGAAPPGRRVGLVLCLLVSAYFLASVVYALGHYEDYAAAEPQFVRYVGAPAVLAAVFLGLGLFGRRYGLAAGLYGLSLLVGLFLFEAFLVTRQVPIWLGMIGRADTAAAGLSPDRAVLRGFTLRTLNNLAGEASLPTAIVSGFPASDVVLCAPGGVPIVYRADRYGFNNPPEAYREPSPVLLLGDSFMEGFCLPRGEEVAGRMRARGMAAVSLGMRGNGPLIELASLGRFAPVLAPRHVVMGFFEGNDWENLRSELTTPWLREALSPDASFGAPADAAPALAKARAAMAALDARPVSLSDLLAQRRIVRNFLALQQTGAALGLAYPKVAQPIPEYAAVLRRAKALAAGVGADFTLLYIPQVDRFLGAFPIDAALDPMRQDVRQAAAAEGVPVVDLTEVFRRHRDPARLYGPDAHFSAEGADVVAGEILRRLDEPAVRGDRLSAVRP